MPGSDKLVQYYIHTDIPQKQMVSIYRRFLKKDRRWHFFHEGNYSLIRTDGKVPAMERYLKNKKMKFDIGIWEDPHPTVRKYQMLFEPVFHSYTILGITGKNEEFNALVNRVVHCFINMCGAPIFEECMALERQAMQIKMIYSERVALSIANQIVGEFKKTLAIDKKV